MKFQQFSFGQIRIDGIEYGYDVVIDRGKVGKRKKKASKKFREAFGHTPLSLEEEIPWDGSLRQSQSCESDARFLVLYSRHSTGRRPAWRTTIIIPITLTPLP